MLVVSSRKRFELEFGWGLAFFLRAPVIGEIFFREENGRWVLDWKKMRDWLK
ncbi:MAG: hypothetical protein JSR29_15885 [Nitrospira sp.]|nr:hypothetical protein [Nitrospira sp.]